ncbi:hypothetical protein [Romboutsia timonensis]|uniref:hypothetical protein n=1 Tax=Romboutsia timonensis TaxID=1776391 RepID=UPI0012B5DE38|nr:hypothetical protein [Romboutsia timonensis]
MYKFLEENIETVVKTLVLICILAVAFFINYKTTEARVERLYKVNNTTFTDVMLEMFR